MLWYFSVSATLLGCIVADPILAHPAHAHDPWRQLNDALSRRATPKKAPGDTIIDSIGAAMSAAIPLVGKMGINVTGDMTETLCKTFATGGFLAKAITSFAGSPNGKGPGEQCVKDNTGGSGLYKSKILEDPTLVNHTIYIPALPLPGNTKAPVIIWSNGFCLPAGTMFANFLNEIASHGYIVIADGPINHGGDLGHTTKAANALKALDWISKNSKRLNVSSDLSNIAMAGQSCGGINVYGAAPDPRFKIAALFNSGDFAGEFGAVKKSWLKPIAYFEGGKADFSRPMAKRDYEGLQATTPAIFADIESGHIGTYYQMYGGKMGKAAVKYFDWMLKNDKSGKAEFCETKMNTTLTQVGFTILTKGGICASH